MDALISNSSKSYYACVGESTHAYQSPSKDLTAINNRLNGHGYDFVYVAITFYFGFVVHEKKKKSTISSSAFSFCSARKLRGSLNFDDVDVGLVSDSMVANSLYLQNGSAASTSGTPLKTEQPDS